MNTNTSVNSFSNKTIGKLSLKTLDTPLRWPEGGSTSVNNGNDI
jgi:hypothetical protein